MKTYRRVFVSQGQLERDFKRWVNRVEEATEWGFDIYWQQFRIVVKSNDLEKQYEVQWLLGNPEKIYGYEPDKVFFDELE